MDVVNSLHDTQYIYLPIGSGETSPQKGVCSPTDRGRGGTLRARSVGLGVLQQQKRRWRWRWHDSGDLQARDGTSTGIRPPQDTCSVGHG